MAIARAVGGEQAWSGRPPRKWAIEPEDWDRPTPCSEWSVRDIVNKMVASTWTFTAFARRERPEPPWDLVHPAEVLGDDPLGTYLDAASEGHVNLFV